MVRGTVQMDLVRGIRKSTQNDMATSKYFKAPSCLSARKAPAHKTDDDTSDTSRSPKDSSESLEKLFVEISKINSTLSTIATDVSTIKQTMAELKATVTVIQERLEEAEERIAHLEDSSERLVNDSSARNKWRHCGTEYKLSKTRADKIT